jgi:hypothetical protein
VRASEMQMQKQGGPLRARTHAVVTKRKTETSGPFGCTGRACARRAEPRCARARTRGARTAPAPRTLAQLRGAGVQVAVGGAARARHEPRQRGQRLAQHLARLRAAGGTHPRATHATSAVEAHAGQGKQRARGACLMGRGKRARMRANTRSANVPPPWLNTAGCLASAMVTSTRMGFSSLPPRSRTAARRAARGARVVSRGGARTCAQALRKA